MTLKVNTAENIPLFQASKWQEVLVLLDVDEMKELLETLGEIYIYPLSGLHPSGSCNTTTEQFLEFYRPYIEALKEGKIPPKLTPLITAITTDPDHLRGVIVKDGMQMHRIVKPVVQTKEGSLYYSSHDRKFRSMVHGEGAISWGMQFAYPQLFQDPEKKTVENALTGEGFPDAKLFRTIQRWLRKNSTIFSVEIDGEKVNTPARIGENCKNWIQNHPQLGLIK